MTSSPYDASDHEYSTTQVDCHVQHTIIESRFTTPLSGSRESRMSRDTRQSPLVRLVGFALSAQKNLFGPGSQ